MTPAILEFINKHWALCLLATGGIILTLGDLVMKKWVVTDLRSYYVIGLLIWIVGLNFLALSFKYKSIAVASMIFIIFNTITLLIAGYLLYGEKISYQEMFGIMLGLCSVALMDLA